MHGATLKNFFLIDSIPLCGLTIYLDTEKWSELDQLWI
jgi:hypothetical protein